MRQITLYLSPHLFCDVAFPSWNPAAFLNSYIEDDTQVLVRPDKPNAPQYIMDITPAVEELGYKPQYSYLEMLRDFKTEMELAENRLLQK